MTVRRVVRLMAALIIVGAVGLAAVAYFGAHEGEPGRLRYAISFALPYAMIGVVSLIAVARDAPGRLIAAGLVLVPLSVLSIVLFPLVIPALVLIGAAVRLPAPGVRWSVETAASLVIACGLLASMVALLAFREQIEWRTATSVHGSEQTTWAGFLLSWAALAIVLFAATIRDERTRAPVDPAHRHRSPSSPRA